MSIQIEGYPHDHELECPPEVEDLLHSFLKRMKKKDYKVSCCLVTGDGYHSTHRTIVVTAMKVPDEDGLETLIVYGQMMLDHDPRWIDIAIHCNYSQERATLFTKEEFMYSVSG